MLQMGYVSCPCARDGHDLAVYWPHVLSINIAPPASGGGFVGRIQAKLICQLQILLLWQQVARRYGCLCADSWS